MFSLRRFVSKTRWVQPVCRGIFNKGPLVDLAVDSDGIGVLTMQRPPINCMNIQFLQELSKSLDKVEQNKCNGLILTSALPTSYSAGADIRELYKPDPKRLELFYTTLQDVWIKLFGCDYPTAAAINGHSPGGGCLLAMACEYRAMVTGNFTIGLNETAIGLLVPRWLILTMANIISQREAEFALTNARMFTVEEAKMVGLIDDIATDKADALEKCKEFIKKFDYIPTSARALAKHNIRQAPLEWMKSNRQADLREFLAFTQSPGVQQNVEMYFQKLKQKSAKKDNGSFGA